MQPPTTQEVYNGHPHGIPVLKVADFGFARILPASAMAETLCGSPLYMAPEILRYEKYDARADLWSVGAVLFEMVAGKPPFRANNHVELLRKIEKGDDRIKFPDESSRTVDKDGVEQPAPVPVSPDIKLLIRNLLKRQPANRIGFEHFFRCGVWEGWMGEKTPSAIDMSYRFSAPPTEYESSKLTELVKSDEDKNRTRPGRTPQPLTADPALNPQPAPPPPIQRQPSTQRSQPKYYVSEAPAERRGGFIDAPELSQAAPRPITRTERRMSVRDKDASSVEDSTPVTPSTGPGPAAMSHRYKATGGSPLAATPPMMPNHGHTGKDESALAGSDSMVGREYVLVEKGQVEVNKLADGE
jgi:serine/threonine-protein kinase ULK/ATG1